MYICNAKKWNEIQKEKINFFFLVDIYNIYILIVLCVFLNDFRCSHHLFINTKFPFSNQFTSYFWFRYLQKDIFFWLRLIYFQWKIMFKWLNWVIVECSTAVFVRRCISSGVNGVELCHCCYWYWTFWNIIYYTDTSIYLHKMSSGIKRRI